MSVTKTLYLVQFEMEPEKGVRGAIQGYLVYAADEAELQEKINNLATTKAQGLPFWGSAVYPHGFVMYREPVAGTIEVEQEDDSSIRE